METFHCSSKSNILTLKEGRKSPSFFLIYETNPKKIRILVLLFIRVVSRKR